LTRHQNHHSGTIEEAAAALCAERAVIISPAKPAVAFGGRKISFLMFPNLLLVELIESALPR